MLQLETLKVFDFASGEKSLRIRMTLNIPFDHQSDLTKAFMHLLHLGVDLRLDLS